jgi:hypothetical protein
MRKILVGLVQLKIKLEKVLEAVPFWPDLVRVAAFVVSPVVGLARAMLRTVPSLRKIEWLMELELLTCRHPVPLALSLAYLCWRGLHPTNLGHIGTDAIVYPLLASISGFNPFLGIVCGIFFGIGDILQKLFYPDIYGARGWSDPNYWAAMGGYILAYSSVMWMGLFPGVVSRVFRLATRKLLQNILARRVAAAADGAGPPDKYAFQKYFDPKSRTFRLDFRDKKVLQDEKVMSVVKGLMEDPRNLLADKDAWRNYPLTPEQRFVLAQMRGQVMLGSEGETKRQEILERAAQLQTMTSAPGVESSLEPAEIEIYPPPGLSDSQIAAEQVIGMLAAFLAADTSMHYVCPKAEAPSFLFRPRPDISCFRLEEKLLAGQGNKTGVFAAAGALAPMVTGIGGSGGSGGSGPPGGSGGDGPGSGPPSSGLQEAIQGLRNSFSANRHDFLQAQQNFQEMQQRFNALPPDQQAILRNDPNFQADLNHYQQAMIEAKQAMNSYQQQLAQLGADTAGGIDPHGDYTRGSASAHLDSDLKNAAAAQDPLREKYENWVKWGMDNSSVAPDGSLRAQNIIDRANVFRPDGTIDPNALNQMINDLKNERNAAANLSSGAHESELAEWDHTIARTELTSKLMTTAGMFGLGFAGALPSAFTASGAALNASLGAAFGYSGSGTLGGTIKGAVGGVAMGAGIEGAVGLLNKVPILGWQVSLSSKGIVLSSPPPKIPNIGAVREGGPRPYTDPHPGQPLLEPPESAPMAEARGPKPPDDDPNMVKTSDIFSDGSKPPGKWQPRNPNLPESGGLHPRPPGAEPKTPLTPEDPGYRRSSSVQQGGWDQGGPTYGHSGGKAQSEYPWEPPPQQPGMPQDSVPPTGAQGQPRVPGRPLPPKEPGVYVSEQPGGEEWRFPPERGGGTAPTKPTDLWSDPPPIPSPSTGTTSSHYDPRNLPPEFQPGSDYVGPGELTPQDPGFGRRWQDPKGIPPDVEGREGLLPHREPGPTGEDFREQWQQAHPGESPRPQLPSEREPIPTTPRGTPGDPQQMPFDPNKVHETWNTPVEGPPPPPPPAGVNPDPYSPANLPPEFQNPPRGYDPRPGLGPEDPGYPLAGGPSGPPGTRPRIPTPEYGGPGPWDPRPSGGEMGRPSPPLSPSSEPPATPVAATDTAPTTSGAVDTPSENAGTASYTESSSPQTASERLPTAPEPVSPPAEAKPVNGYPHAESATSAEAASRVQQLSAERVDVRTGAGEPLGQVDNIDVRMSSKQYVVWRDNQGSVKNVTFGDGMSSADKKRILSQLGSDLPPDVLRRIRNQFNRG